MVRACEARACEAHACETHVFGTHASEAHAAEGHASAGSAEAAHHAPATSSRVVMQYQSKRERQDNKQEHRGLHVL